MQKNNRLSQTGRTKNKCIILISFLVVALFSISFSSAISKSYDNETKTVTIKDTFLFIPVGDIAEVQLKTDWNNDGIVDLNKRVGLGYQRVAQFEVRGQKDWEDVLLKKIETYDKKSYEEGNKTQLLRHFDYKIKSYKEVVVDDWDCEYENLSNGTVINNCFISGNHTEEREVWLPFNINITIKENQNYTIGLYTDVKKGDYVEWIPTFLDEKVEEWATWTADLDNDLYSYYKLDDNAANTTILDELGNDSAVASSNTNTLTTTGKINNAIEFDGSTTEITDAALVDYEDFSIGGWFYTSDTVSGQAIYTMRSGSSANPIVAIKTFDGDIFFRLRSNTGSGITKLIYPISYSPNTWYFFTATYDKSTGLQRLYVNDGESVNVTYSGGDFSDVNQGAIGLTNSITKGDYFTGKIDEIFVYKRVLSPQEILDLYNNGDGLTFHGAGEGPKVTLNSPSNNSNLTSPNVDFITTVTDDLYVENVTLILDGVINETITTHVNGSYTFSKTIDEGYHNWSILAYDNDSFYNQSETWYFNYSAPPVFIELISPNALYESKNKTVNMTCMGYKSDGILNLNMTIDGVVNQSITNSTPEENLTISTLLIFDEGTHNWSCSGSNDISSTTSPERSFTINTTPTIDYIIPPTLVDYANISQEYIPIKVNVSTFYFKNITYYLSNVNGTSFYKYYDNETFDINFTNIPDGHYHYFVEVCTTTNKCSKTGIRHINHDNTNPEINITSPSTTFDYLIDGDILDLNWTVTDENIDKCWYDYYNNEVSVFSDNSGLPNWFDEDTSTVGEYTGSFNVSDKINEIIQVFTQYYESEYNYQYYTLNISDCPIVGNKIQIDAEAGGNSFYGYWNSLSCGGNILSNVSRGSFTATAFFYPAEIIVNKTYVDCNQNTTIFEYIQGKNNLTFYSSDTYGNIGNETRSWNILIGSFNLDYESPVYEGYENTINATIQGLSSNSSLTSALLYYNGVNYSTSIDYDSGDYLISSTLSAPPVTSDTNYTFGFYLTIDGNVYDPQSNNQTVINADFGECGGVSNDTILNINLEDERSQLSILGDIEVGGEIISVSSGDVIGAIYTNFTNVSNASLCFSPPSSYDLYYMDAEIRYTSDGYSTELYHIQNADITEDLGNLTLYDLNSSDATLFDITYQDNSFNFLDGAILQLQRKYIEEGVYKTVEAPLTSNNGVAVLHIDLDTVKYRATVVKDGVVLNEFDNLVFKCESELTGECTEKLLGSIDPENQVDLDNIRDFSYSEPVLDNDSITVSFSIPSGSPSSVNVVLEQKDEFGNKTLCNKTILSSAGSISCEYSETLGKSYIDFSIYNNGQPIAIKSYSVKNSSSLDWLGNNYIFIFILLLSLVGMALTSPEWIIVNGILTMVISGGLYLANGIDFVVGLGSIMWLLIAAIIIISKMSKQEDR